jgi:hypothetical protein
MMNTAKRIGNYRKFRISKDIEDRVTKFIIESNYPRIISRETVLDGIDPDNIKGHHRRGSADFTQIRKEISYIIPKLGYEIHCASDKNRVFVRCKQ